MSVNPTPAARGATNLQALVQLVIKYWPLLSSGAAVAVFVFFFGQARMAFEDYIRSVVYPGSQSVVTDEQSKSTMERYMNTAQYIRHAVIPSIEFPGSGTTQYEKLDDIKRMNTKYTVQLQKEATRLLFPDIEKPTSDETLVAWFQKSIQTYLTAQKDNASSVSVGAVLADNHRIVTDAIVGGVYSGNVRISRENPDYTVPLLVPVRNSVRLIYSCTGNPERKLYVTVKKRGLAAKYENPMLLESAGIDDLDLTKEFARVREITGSTTDPLKADFFQVVLGARKQEEAKLELEDRKAIKESAATSTTVDEQLANLVYLIVVDKGIDRGWK